MSETKHPILNLNGHALVDQGARDAAAQSAAAANAAAAAAAANAEKIGKLSKEKAYQQYVTDGEGKAVWEDRLAYKETKLAYANEQSLSSATLSKNEDGIYHLQDIDMPYQDVGNPNCVRVSCEYGVFEGKVDNFADHLPYIHGIENVTLTNVSDPSQSMNFTCYYAGYVSNGSWTFRINSASGVDFGNKETVTVDVTFTHATEETTIVPIPAEYLPVTAVVITKQNDVVSCNTPLENIPACIMKGTPWIYVRDDGESLESLSDVKPTYVKAENVCFINVYGGSGSYLTGFEYNANGITESVDG